MLGQAIGAEIRRLRKAREWTQEDLAQRLEDLDAHINRVTLTKIEQGGERAENLKLRELLVLAAALDTSPVSLVFPVGRVELVEITPQLRIFSALASKWFCAEVALTDEERVQINLYEWQQATSGTRAHRLADRLSDEVRKARRQVSSAQYVGDQDQIKAAKAAHVDALHALERLYREMDRDGIAPPGETRETVEEWKAIDIEVPEHWLWERKNDDE